jgi:hypothetical protein
MTMAITVTGMDYHLSPTKTITMPPSTKPGTRPTMTAHENTAMLAPWPVATTMDYHLSPTITTSLSMKTGTIIYHDDGQKFQHAATDDGGHIGYHHKMVNR